MATEQSGFEGPSVKADVSILTARDLVEISFHGARLIAVQGDTPETTLVAMKPIVEGMGLDWKSQYDKLRGHPVLATCVGISTMQMSGDDQVREVTCLPLNRLNFWLATIQPNRVPDPAIRRTVIAYQIECADALFNRFFGGRLAPHDHTVLSPAFRAEMIEIARDIVPRMVAMAIAADPRVAVGEYVSVRELLDEAKALPKGRNGVNRRIGKALRDICLREGGARRCPRTRTWLFPVARAHEYMRTDGLALVADHNASVTGQGRLHLVQPKGAAEAANRPAAC